MKEKSLEEGLADSDYRVRMQTIHALVERGYKEAVPLLLALLRDREMPVRNAAIVALGAFADQQAFEPLAACLTASYSLERKNTVEALVALGDPRRRDVFLEALKTEKDSRVRVGLTKAISVFPDEVVLEALIGLLADRDEDVRAIAALALGKQRQPLAIPALQRMALTDMNQEICIHGLAYKIGTLAEYAIQMILHPEQEQGIDWPDVVNL